MAWKITDMRDGDEKYKLGELTADMAAVKHDIIEIKETQKEIVHKLDSFNAVSVEQWSTRNAYVDQMLGAHDTRLELLETVNKLREASIWIKIGRSFETKLVNWIGATVLIFALSVGYFALKNDIEQNRQVIKEVKE